MQKELILKADAAKALEVYAHQVFEKGTLKEAYIAHKCLYIVRNIPAFGETMHAKWIDKDGYIACSNCGQHGYKPWKRCPMCEAKMDLGET